ncbi:MAG: anti-sigma factor [Thermoanaerobaculia bacterium]
MTCRELIDFLMSFLEGELPAAQTESFENHLRICPHCTSYLDSYRTTVKLARQVCKEPDDGVPADVPEDLVDAILEARGAAG